MIKNRLIHWLKSHRPVLTTAGTIEAVYQLGCMDSRAIERRCTRAAINIERRCTRAAINPVIHDLERLRANTWDQDKITYLQNWLRDNFMEDTNYGQTQQD